MICAQLQRLCHLSLVDPIKQMTVMNQEAGADTPSSCEFSHHQIEAKYLHIGDALATLAINADIDRSEEHTSELQSLMRISYAVFSMKNKNISNTKQPIT